MNAEASLDMIIRVLEPVGSSAPVFVEIIETDEGTIEIIEVLLGL
jgi:hypothetical protein